MKRILLGGLALLFAGISTAAVQTNQPAPDFTLVDVNGQQRSLSEFKGKTVVLEWHNHECPFVRKHYESGNMQGQQRKYVDQGIVWLGINSSAPGKQGHVSPDQAKEVATANEAVYSAYLFDTNGDVGRTYGAKTTPHMYIINPEGVLTYQGGIDSIRSSNQADIPKARQHVVFALDEMLAGKTVSVQSSTPYGCSVKY